MRSPPRRAVVLAAVTVAALAAAAWWAWPFAAPPPAGPPAPETPPLAPLSTSPYLNARPGAAAYVGSAACAGCHDGEHQSYQKTGMSRSSAAVGRGGGPPDGAVEHPASGRRFEARRADGRPHHRELPLDPARSDAVLTDLPLAYAIGSGRHARTFAADADGFLVESPITWYAARRAWGMSPGYDHARHKGFERPIGGHCLFCHTGRAEPVDRSVHKFRVVEPAIGCERCHGPGSIHVARWRDAPGDPLTPDGPGDLTVVNPRRLPRALAEAVCQQCHLAGDTVVAPRGRTLADFRPGLPVEDFHLVFRLADATGGMTVTGHVDQLHQSKCYQRSTTLTCATCHNPHAVPAPADRAAHYRAVCTSCHAEAACKAPPPARRAADPQNGCVRCHMPTGATDVPHVAFSHHRIGVHPAAPPPGGRGGSGEALEPFHALARLGGADRKRALGLAYAKGGAHAEIGPAARRFTHRAHQLLTEAWDAGVRDGAVAAALAVTEYRLGLRDGRAYAEAAVRDLDLDPERRCDALFLLADDAYRRGEYAAAAESLREVTRLRRAAADWSYLARCEFAQGRDAEGLRLLEVAAGIGTTAPRLRIELADLLERAGNPGRAAWHRRRVP